MKEEGEVKVLVNYQNNNANVEPVYKTYKDNLPKTSGAYTSFKGSPLSSGEFHWELWNSNQNM